MLNCVTWGHCAVCGCPLCFVNAFYGWPPLTVFVVDNDSFQRNDVAFFVSGVWSVVCGRRRRESRKGIRPINLLKISNIFCEV
jgi:hypothetical protein